MKQRTAARRKHCHSCAVARPRGTSAQRGVGGGVGESSETTAAPAAAGAKTTTSASMGGRGRDRLRIKLGQGRRVRYTSSEAGTVTRRLPLCKRSKALPNGWPLILSHPPFASVFCLLQKTSPLSRLGECCVPFCFRGATANTVVPRLWLRRPLLDPRCTRCYPGTAQSWSGYAPFIISLQRSTALARQRFSTNPPHTPQGRLPSPPTPATTPDCPLPLPPPSSCPPSLLSTRFRSPTRPSHPCAGHLRLARALDHHLASLWRHTHGCAPSALDAPRPAFSSRRRLDETTIPSKPSSLLVDPLAVESHSRRPPSHAAATTTSSARFTLPDLCMVAERRSALADPSAADLDPLCSPAA